MITVEICGVHVSVGKSHVLVRDGKIRRTYWIAKDGEITTNVVKIAGDGMNFPRFAPWD